MVSKKVTQAQAKALRDADGGYSSRKLWYAIGTSVAIVGVGLVAAFVPLFRSSLETVVGGLCGTLAIYAGANVTGKWAIGKAASYGGYGMPYDDGSGYGFGGYGGGYGNVNVNVSPGRPNPRPPVEPIPEEQ
jgi:hypothetical protein